VSTFYLQHSRSFPFDVTLRQRHHNHQHEQLQQQQQHTGGSKRAGRLTLSAVDAADAGMYSCHSLLRDRATIR
jgi:hypothetical protein